MVIIWVYETLPMFYGKIWLGVSIEHFIEQLNNYIELLNEKRIKLSLGGMNPVEYRRSIGLST